MGEDTGGTKVGKNQQWKREPTGFTVFVRQHRAEAEEAEVQHCVKNEWSCFISEDLLKVGSLQKKEVSDKVRRQVWPLILIIRAQSGAVDRMPQERATSSRAKMNLSTGSGKWQQQQPDA